MRRAAVSQVCIPFSFFPPLICGGFCFCAHTQIWSSGRLPFTHTYTQLFAAPLATAKTAEQSVTPPLWSLSSFTPIALDFRGGRCYFYSAGNRIAGRKKLGHGITLWKRAVVLDFYVLVFWFFFKEAGSYFYRKTDVAPREAVVFHIKQHGAVTAGPRRWLNSILMQSNCSPEARRAPFSSKSSQKWEPVQRRRMRYSRGSVSHLYANWDKKLIRSAAESQEGDVFSLAPWDSLLKTPPQESRSGDADAFTYTSTEKKSVSTFKAAPVLCLSSQFKLD